MNVRTEGFPYAFPLLDGGMFRSADMLGKIVAMEIWASWCDPCVERFADLQRAHDRYARRGDVVIVAVNLNEERKIVEAARDRGECEFPMAMTRGTANPELRNTGLPALGGDGRDVALGLPRTLIFGPHGDIHYVRTGDEGYDGLVSQIESLVPRVR